MGLLACEKVLAMSLENRKEAEVCGLLEIKFLIQRAHAMLVMTCLEHNTLQTLLYNSSDKRPLIKHLVCSRTESFQQLSKRVAPCLFAWVRISMWDYVVTTIVLSSTIKS